MEIVMRGVLTAFLLFCFAPFAMAEEGSYNYSSQALQGDLSGAEQALRKQDKEQYKTFKARFLKGTDGLDLSEIEDAGVRAVAEAYQDYWRAALMAPEQRPQHEAALLTSLRAIIDTHDIGHEGEADVFLSETELKRFQQEPAQSESDIGAATIRLLPWIEKRGLHGLTGRTSPLLEFMLWRDTRRTETEVELTDGKAFVPVIYLDDFVSGGWAYFATFERSRAGGWAKVDGIYVVDEAYPDKTVESFAISYLKHEARHYVDARRYPKLSSADREYRAKLTELVFAQESFRHLIANFKNQAARIDVPHPLANWHVIHGLEGRLFSAEAAPADWWETVEHEAVRAAAMKLLEVHTAKLEEDGAAETQGVVRI